MARTIVGFLLVDAPWSALNNAGQEVGERAENIVRVKSVRKGRHLYPYVSGQAFRYWWRQTLKDKFDWNLSPIIREAKIAFTYADPFTYEDDDMFGYMRALKKSEGGTVTRISPLKNSPLLSLYPHTPTHDFGVMARHQEGDPVPYEHEFYSTILKGIFSLDMDNVGKFYEIEKTGYKNMYPSLIEKASEFDAVKDDDQKSWLLPTSTRKKRIKETLLALSYLSGGAKHAQHLTDVSPKFMVLTLINSGNHIFMNIADEQGIKLDALSEVVEDYKDIILTDIFIGKRRGFMDEMNEDLEEFSEKRWNGGKIKVEIGALNNVLRKFVRVVEEFLE